MSFRDDTKRISVRIQTREQRKFVAFTEAIGGSVRFGSPITGAPGQPVDEGTLRASWVDEFAGPDSWQMSTNLVYAPNIEAGVGPHGPLTLRSQVGGFHSVAHTVANAQALMDHVSREIPNG